MNKFFWVNMFVNLLFIVLVFALTAQTNFEAWMINSLIIIAGQKFTLMTYRMATKEQQVSVIEKKLEDKNV